MSILILFDLAWIVAYIDTITRYHDEQLFRAMEILLEEAGLPAAVPA